MTSLRLLSIGVLAALAAASLVACTRQATPPASEESDQNRIIPVAAQPAQVGSLRAVIHVSGTIVPADGAEFLAVAPEPARVIDVTKNQGDAVAAGELIVRFELPGVTQEVARQQADLARAQAQLENVRVNRDRLADFVARGLVARNDLNQADRDLTEAQAAVTVASGALKQAEDTLARSSIRTPFSGIVANRLHNPGDIAQASVTDPVLRVVDPGRLEILALIPGADASRVLPGAPARIAGAVDGQMVNLSVAARAGGQPDASGNLRVRLTFLTPAPMMMVDTSVELDIDAEERTNVVFVPASALVATGKEAAVFVADGDTARRRAVMTGVTSDRGVEITSGLNAGELVLTRGQDNVSDGARISVEVVR